MYNVRIKDFGNGRKQYTLYSKPVDSTKSIDDKLVDDIRFYEELLVNANDEQKRFIIKRITALKDKAESEKAALPCEMSDWQYGKFLEHKEESRLLYQLGNDKRAKKKIWDYSRANTWDYFLTFTFNQECVDRYDYEACKKKLTKWLDNVSRRYCGGCLKYLVVPEQHKDGAWHFHGLFANSDGIVYSDSGVKDAKGRIVYNLPQYKLGFTTATAVTDTHRVSLYITKYVTKAVCTTLNGKRRYLASNNLSLPKETYLLTENIDEFIINMYNNNHDLDVEWTQQKDYEICGDKRYMLILETNES